MQLPAEFHTAHFLDPAFLAGIANELFAEGRPPELTGVPAGAGEMPSAEVPVVGFGPGALPAQGDPMRAARRAPVDYHDPGLFLGIGDEFLPPLAPGVPDSLPVPADPGGSESFYFLTQQTPAAPPVSAAPSPAGFSETAGLPTGGEGYYFLPQTGAKELSSKPAPAQTAVPAGPVYSRTFNVESVRKDFPILHQRVHGKPLIWLDNAATTQKPRQVIDALTHFYEHDNSNIHRAAHTLAARATEPTRGARQGAAIPRGRPGRGNRLRPRGHRRRSTSSPRRSGDKNIEKGDEIVVSEIEHHANIVPWQQLAKEKGAVLRVVPVNDRGEVLLEEYEKLLGPRTRLVALTHVSNALGTMLPVRTMIQLARRHGARVLVDGARRCPIWPWTCRRWTATSTSSPATSCSGRPASAWSTGSARCSRPCRPGKAAAT